MQPRHIPLKYHQKLRKLYTDSFYLSPTLRTELIAQLEEGSIRRDREAIAYVDQHGEWLDG